MTRIQKYKIHKFKNIITFNYLQVPSEQTALKAGGGELHRISCVTFSLIKKKRNIVWVGASKRNFVKTLL